MKAVENKAVLITYPDSLGGDIGALNDILDKYIGDAIGGVHILPFFPSSADRGFAPLTYREVGARFGSWEDIHKIGQRYYLIFDFMINHISAKSDYYLDFLKNKEESAYKQLFIRYDDFWDNGEPTEKQLDLIYKRKPRPPYTQALFSDGTREKIWCTFDDQQIDINYDTKTGRDFLDTNLKWLAEKGATIIRLDAFAYAIKRKGTSCFYIEPQIWELLEQSKDAVQPYGALVLPEIHEHYTLQKKLEARGYWCYDFSLPMLLLHAIYFGEVDYLYRWLKICPRKQFTTLDTHDGIGVVDVRGLLPEEEIEKTQAYLFQHGANAKRVYNSEKYHNLDIYQLNCTYYSALSNNDNDYLLARAVQLFAPGIPQIYYVGLFAGINDIALIEKTKNGRDINRHNYTENELKQELKRPVVNRLLEMLKFRNTHPAFQGEFTFERVSLSELKLIWDNENSRATLTVDFKKKKFKIETQ